MELEKLMELFDCLDQIDREILSLQKKRNKLQIKIVNDFSFETLTKEVRKAYRVRIEGLKKNNWKGDHMLTPLMFAAVLAIIFLLAMHHIWKKK